MWLALVEAGQSKRATPLGCLTALALGSVVPTLWQAKGGQTQAMPTPDSVDACSAACQARLRAQRRLHLRGERNSGLLVRRARRLRPGTKETREREREREEREYELKRRESYKRVRIEDKGELQSR